MRRLTTARIGYSTKAALVSLFRPHRSHFSRGKPRAGRTAARISLSCHGPSLSRGVLATRGKRVADRVSVRTGARQTGLAARLVQGAVPACWQVGRGALSGPGSPILSIGGGLRRMVSFCYFFFVDNIARPVDKVRCRNPRNWVEKGLAPGYGFPGCNPYCARLRSRPLVEDWMHPGPMFAGSIPDSLMGRWPRPSEPLV